MCVYMCMYIHIIKTYDNLTRACATWKVYLVLLRNIHKIAFVAIIYFRIKIHEENYLPN